MRYLYFGSQIHFLPSMLFFLKHRGLEASKLHIPDSLGNWLLAVFLWWEALVWIWKVRGENDIFLFLGCLQQQRRRRWTDLDLGAILKQESPIHSCGKGAGATSAAQCSWAPVVAKTVPVVGNVRIPSFCLECVCSVHWWLLCKVQVGTCPSEHCENETERHAKNSQPKLKCRNQKISLKSFN